jgi:hypothetical protein
VEGPKFAQKTFSSTFRGGELAARSISDGAGDLSSGALEPKDVPVGMIVRDGDTLIPNCLRVFQQVLPTSVAATSHGLVTFWDRQRGRKVAHGHLQQWPGNDEISIASLSRRVLISRIQPQRDCR